MALIKNLWGSVKSVDGKYNAVASMVNNEFNITEKENDED